MIERHSARWRATVRRRAGSRQDALITVVLFIVFTVLRIPFLSRYLVNWDAVQFALGTRSFDLAHHQPHPPGYPGYISLGAALNLFTGDPNRSFVLMSVVGGALAVAALYQLGRRFMPGRFALIAAMLFGTSPLLWYYSEVALTYAPATGVALWFIVAAWDARARRQPSRLLVASGLLALLGAIRPTDMVLLLPVWGYAALPFARRERARAAGLLAVLILIWLTPLLWLAGGPVAYVRESLALYDTVGERTSIFSEQFAGPLKNAFMVTVGALLGVNLGLALIAAVSLRDRSPLDDVTRDSRRFAVLWAAPFLAVYLLGHTGQLGYVLPILPILFLGVGLSLTRLARDVVPASASRRERRHAPIRLLSWTLGLLLLANIGGFLVLPGTLYAEASANGNKTGSDLARQLLQYDIRENDAHWRAMTTLVAQYDPDTTAILTTIGGPQSSGSFRELSFYTPAYRVYGLGKGQNGQFGFLFSAQQGASNYSLDATVAVPAVALPSGVRQIIIPDLELGRRLGNSFTVWWLMLSDGSRVAVAPVPDGSLLGFGPAGRLMLEGTATQLAENRPNPD